MRKISLKNVIVTGLAIATMSITVLAESSVFTNVSRITPDTCWVSKKQEFEYTATHTVKPEYDTVYSGGDAYYKITYKILGTHFAEAQAIHGVSKNKGGHAYNLTMNKKAKGDKTRYHFIYSEEGGDFTLESYTDKY